MSCSVHGWTRKTKKDLFVAKLWITCTLDKKLADSHILTCGLVWLFWNCFNVLVLPVTRRFISADNLHRCSDRTHRDCCQPPSVSRGKEWKVKGLLHAMWRASWGGDSAGVRVLPVRRAVDGQLFFPEALCRAVCRHAVGERRAARRLAAPLPIVHPDTDNTGDPGQRKEGHRLVCGGGIVSSLFSDNLLTHQVHFEKNDFSRCSTVWLTQSKQPFRSLTRHINLIGTNWNPLEID